MPTSGPKATRCDLGGCSITLLSGGAIKLDGGAMFGIIPKPLWQRSTPADDKNRIQLACNCLLVEWDGPGARRAIMETGHGSKYGEKEQRVYGIDASSWLLSDLRSRGIEPETIDDVIMTHLHFDHAGGLTHRVDEHVAAVFPKARVHVQRREFDDAKSGFGIMTATYREENFGSISDADAWRLLDGETEIIPGVRAMLTPGHTHGHQSLIVEGRDRTAVFAGDVMPTAAHVGAPWNMAYDLMPLENRESKRRLLTRAAAERWLVVVGHEPNTPLVHVEQDGDWFVLRPFES